MTTATDNLFTGIAPHVPTRYAPGHSYEPYPYTVQGIWSPVIYRRSVVTEPDGRLARIVDPFPAATADRTLDRDPITIDNPRAVAVLCGATAPMPRGRDLDGDWTIPAAFTASELAYDVTIASDEHLMAAWCEAHAVAAALNNGTVRRLGLKPEDVEALLGAERSVLCGDSRLAGKRGELRWARVDTAGLLRREQWLTARQTRRLRDGLVALIQPTGTRVGVPRLEGKLSSAGARWVETTYGLTSAGRNALDTIRAQYDGPVRCRVCGCTDDRGCPPAVDGGMPCSWVDADLCSACPGGRR